MAICEHAGAGPAQPARSQDCHRLWEPAKGTAMRTLKGRSILLSNAGSCSGVHQDFFQRARQCSQISVECSAGRSIPLQSTGVQSKGSQEQGQPHQQRQHDNTNSTQHRDLQPTSAPNASNDHPTLVIGDLSPWRHLTARSPCQEAAVWSVEYGATSCNLLRCPAHLRPTAPNPQDVTPSPQPAT